MAILVVGFLGVLLTCIVVDVVWVWNPGGYGPVLGIVALIILIGVCSCCVYDLRAAKAKARAKKKTASEPSSGAACCAAPAGTVKNSSRMVQQL